MKIIKGRSGHPNSFYFSDRNKHRMKNMSFVDLATLTMHRRQELETRTFVFEEKCDRAINDIKNLKMKARSFASQLNCDPAELKERFLGLMQKLDEYIYVITDFNLAMAQTVDTDSMENTPVQDLSNMPPSLSPFNLLDALSEPLPPAGTRMPVHSAPSGSPALRPQPQRLIMFSGSSSAESVPLTSDKQQPLSLDIAGLAIEEPVSPTPVATSMSDNHKECCVTAAQTMLEVDHEYPATIIYVDSCHSFSVITEEPEIVAMFMSDMTEYYKRNLKVLSAAELNNMTYCAYCDEGVYYRAMILSKSEGDDKTVNVYVIDTGEQRTTSVDNMQPLAKQFCDLPPFARPCHLAGLDFGENLNNKMLKKRQEDFMKKYSGSHCFIYVDDNSSESLGVFVKIPTLNVTLNQLMVDLSLAILIDKPVQDYQEETHSNVSSEIICPPAEASDVERHMGNIDHSQYPEYTDPVVAVTGYHNRDEADICRHYKGGPEKTCFKGARCTKKHILHHPGLFMDQLSVSGMSIESNACSYRSINKERTDGWTYDQMEVTGRCTPAVLPPVGAWTNVLVTNVCHFDRLFVQIINDQEEEKIPEFGMVSPPRTLASLIRNMNSPVAIQSYKPLTIIPALGEIVAAQYPEDHLWYRAKVLTIQRLDQSVEVMFVDYGTIAWVKENAVSQLEARFAVLPVQAVQCALAGVRGLPRAGSDQWAHAKRALQKLAENNLFEAHVIAREYDEIIVELFSYDNPNDESMKTNLAEKLAEGGLVELVEYAVIDDNATQKLVVP